MTFPGDPPTLPDILSPRYRQLTYLATPHTHEDPAVRHERERVAAVYTGHLVRNDIAVFSPILYSTSLRDFGAEPSSWYDFDLHFLRRATDLLVLPLPEWETSYGVKIEITYARTLGIPIAFDHSWREVVVELTGYTSL